MTDRAPVDVSVVIPLFNRARLVPFTLEALRPDRHPGVALDVIVVDDGSTDDGAAVAKETLPGIRLLSTPNHGAPHARNAGLADARGEFLLLLDSDDVVEPGFFAPRAAALRAHPPAAAAYGPFDFFAGETDFRADLILPRYEPYPVEPWVERDGHLWRLLAGWYLPPPTLLWRTSVVRSLGGHDETLRINQDVDLVFRALLAGSGIVGCSAPRGLYRDHSTGARQGALAGDARKAKDLLQLRRGFARELEKAGLLGSQAREALGSYCFYTWFELRDTFPDIAEEFYRLSRSLYPNLTVPGRWPLRFLSATLGPRRAMEIKGALR
jgi:glycosyltransferase involved in cell wall biosynthesis